MDDSCLQTRYLGSIGGKDVPEATRRILRSLMANSLALKMNFAGRGDKVGIAELKITKVIISMLVVCFILLCEFYQYLV